ncbi:hypothetical protein OpiT1DRAFT_02698 [Opitutaceae bacterium TAV1]|nr:hypothetical protein OpiT1DRAFT_02698 [Opitutaceae bacterium TAV1]
MKRLSTLTLCGSLLLAGGAPGVAADSASVTATSPANAIDAVKAESASLLEQITKSLTGLASQAGTTAGATPAAGDSFVSQLQSLATSIQSGDDAGASGTLQKLMAAKPTDGQLAVLDDVRNNFALLALGRNFDTASSATQSAVGSAITAIKTGNATDIVTSLQGLYSNARLTDTQKELVTGLVGSWNPKLADVATKAGKLRDTAKLFGF